MLVNFADDLRQPWTTAFFDRIYNGPARSVADYFAQSSQGKLAVTASVSGWYTLTTKITSCDLLAVSTQADLAATAAGVNLTTFTNKVYVFPANSCFGGGRGEMPGSRSWIGMPVDAACPDPALNNCQHFHLFPHELGHNIGLDHANNLFCTDDTGNPVYFSATCTVQLGDIYAVMGCCQPALLDNVRRAQLGWVPPPVTVSTTTTLTVTPAYAAGSTIYRIPDGAGQFFYLENRATGPVYDVGPWPNGNLLVRRAPELSTVGRCQSGCYAMTDLLAGRNLDVGLSFSFANVTVSNQAWDGANNTVQVTYN